MVTQEVELPIEPAALSARCRGEPFVVAFDGGSEASWDCGRALLGFRPRATLRVAASGAAVVRCGASAQRWHGDPFALLDRFRTAWAGVCERGTDPFAGAVVVALSYDLRHWAERLRRHRPTDLERPVLHAAFYDWLLSYSYADGRYQLAAVDGSPADLRRITAHLRALAAAPAPRAALATSAPVVPDWSKEQYLAAVRTALDYIAAGDVYQVNLAQRFVTYAPPSPAVLFAALRRQHPVPFAAYLDGGDWVLVSNSPECFLTLRGATVATFPVKGTRPRGTDPAADRRLAAELEHDAKERAEHVMIVDLERNDLGRVCRTGSVRVEEFSRVHTFPSLHHMVSKVTGELRPGMALADVLRATFPGGSITGAPKIRAMEIIDELEPVGRGFYTGAIGFIRMDGRAVFNLAIRTAVVTGRQFTYHAGGGIVADSDPVREYEETLLKAQPLFTALAASAA